MSTVRGPRFLLVRLRAPLFSALACHPKPTSITPGPPSLTWPAPVGVLRLFRWAKDGADDRDRTGDLVLTKDVLCQLSYIGLRPSGFGRQVGPASTCRTAYPTSRGGVGAPADARVAIDRGRRLERETGIEPATNSLEGCDSTTELLPPTRSTATRSSRVGRRAYRKALQPSLLALPHPHLPNQPNLSSGPTRLTSATNLHQADALNLARAHRARGRLVGRGGFEPP
jgi:hypothetical protein